MAVKTRTKSKKANGASNKEKLHDVVQIDVADLRQGDRIATVFQEDPVTGIRKAIKTKRIDKLGECPSRWRSCVHINKTECYDIRAKVWVVA